ncbi:AMP-binding protein, partial [Vibrio parahaemolyticus]
VGEPINPEAWEWYHRVVGDHRCPIVDTWWQTETGGILITPLPGATKLKPGSATQALDHERGGDRGCRRRPCRDDDQRPAGGGGRRMTAFTVGDVVAERSVHLTRES